MTRYTAIADRHRDGTVETFTDDNSPDIVLDVASAMADAMNGQPEVDRLEIIIEVNP